MGIIKVGKIQSTGEVIGEKYVKILWFESVNSGTNGTLTAPAQGEILLDQWATGVDALASTISSGVPTFISPTTAGGVIVTATLGIDGAWTLSGTPSAYPVAIIYAYQVRLKYFDYTKQLGEFELIPSAGGVFTDVANFNKNLSSADTTVQKALDKLDDLVTADHAVVTLKTGHDVALSISGQELDLADVLTPTEHTSIGNGSPHHAPISLGVGNDPALALAGQTLTLTLPASGIDFATAAILGTL